MNNEQILVSLYELLKITEDPETIERIYKEIKNYERGENEKEETHNPNQRESGQDEV